MDFQVADLAAIRQIWRYSGGFERKAPIYTGAGCRSGTPDPNVTIIIKIR